MGGFFMEKTLYKRARKEVNRMKNNEQTFGKYEKAKLVTNGDHSHVRGALVLESGRYTRLDIKPHVFPGSEPVTVFSLNGAQEKLNPLSEGTVDIASFYTENGEGVDVVPFSTTFPVETDHNRDVAGFHARAKFAWDVKDYSDITDQLTDPYAPVELPDGSVTTPLYALVEKMEKTFTDLQYTPTPAVTEQGFLELGEMLAKEHINDQEYTSTVRDLILTGFSRITTTEGVPTVTHSRKYRMEHMYWKRLAEGKTAKP